MANTTLNKVIANKLTKTQYDIAVASGTITPAMIREQLWLFTDDQFVSASDKTNWNSKADTSAIPTKTSQLTNDSNFATTSQIPTKTSDLTNDSGFITNASIPTNVSSFTNDAGYITSAAIPTNVSSFTNDAGYLTQETDPTVPSWAKEPTKPTYTKSEIGLGNVDNKSSETIRSEITSSNVTVALGYTPISSSEKAAYNGVATLDGSGKVPTAQLPSYVDDVIEGYYNTSDNKFYEDSSYTTEIPGESGKIYVDLTTNKTYRWGGSSFVVIASDLALGTTHSTAYYGDLGEIAYNHSQLAHAPVNAEPNVIDSISVNSTQLTPDANKNVNITIPTNVSSFTNDSGYITKDVNDLTNYYLKSQTYTQTEVDNLLANIDQFEMTVLTYGSSTWQDFITAYQNNSVILCRAASGSNPAATNKTRFGFMAYVDNETNPTYVEFHYFRSVSTKTSSSQTDEIYIYKLSNQSSWSVTVRKVATSIVAGTGLSLSYNSSTATATLNVDSSGVRSVSSIILYFKTVNAGASAPSVPTTITPTQADGWSTSEPALDLTKDLYATLETIYSDNTFEYSTPQKYSSYEAAKTAQTTANLALSRVPEKSLNPPTDTSKLWLDLTTNTLKQWIENQSTPGTGTWEIINDFSSDINNLQQSYNSLSNQITLTNNALDDLKGMPTQGEYTITIDTAIPVGESVTINNITYSPLTSLTAAEQADAIKTLLEADPDISASYTFTVTDNVITYTENDNYYGIGNLSLDTSDLSTGVVLENTITQGIPGYDGETTVYSLKQDILNLQQTTDNFPLNYVSNDRFQTLYDYYENYLQAENKYVRLVDNTIIVGFDELSNNPYTMRITNGSIGIYYYDEPTMIWNTNISTAQSIVTNDLKIQNFKFVPRDNGSLSFRKVD